MTIDEKALQAAIPVGSNIANEFLVRRIIEAYESAKPKEATCKESLQLRLGSRLTVDGVEAVVVPAEPTEGMIAAGQRFTPIVIGTYLAMLSAAGERPDWDDLRGIALDATGDQSSEAFIREQRDGWEK